MAAPKIHVGPLDLPEVTVSDAKSFALHLLRLRQADKVKPCEMVHVQCSKKFTAKQQKALASRARHWAGMEVKISSNAYALFVEVVSMGDVPETTLVDVKEITETIDTVKSRLGDDFQINFTGFEEDLGFFGGEECMFSVSKKRR